MGPSRPGRHPQASARSANMRFSASRGMHSRGEGIEGATEGPPIEVDCTFVLHCFRSEHSDPHRDMRRAAEISFDISSTTAPPLRHRIATVLNADVSPLPRADRRRHPSFTTRRRANKKKLLPLREHNESAKFRTKTTSDDLNVLSARGRHRS